MESIKLYSLSANAEYYLYNPITDYYSGPLKPSDFKLHAKLDVTGKGMEFKPYWVYAGTHYEYQSIYKSIGSNFVRLDDCGDKFSTVVEEDTYLTLDRDSTPPTDCLSYDWRHRLNHKEANNG